jgi:hypothetical protein
MKNAKHFTEYKDETKDANCEKDELKIVSNNYQYFGKVVIIFSKNVIQCNCRDWQ